MKSHYHSFVPSLMRYISDHNCVFPLLPRIKLLMDYSINIFTCVYDFSLLFFPSSYLILPLPALPCCCIIFTSLHLSSCTSPYLILPFLTTHHLIVHSFSFPLLSVLYLTLPSLASLPLPYYTLLTLFSYIPSLLCSFLCFLSLPFPPLP